MTAQQLDQDLQNAICDGYMAGSGLAKLSNYFGCSYTGARNAVQRCGKLRTLKEARALVPNRYTCRVPNPEFITQQTAYWLGMLNADGNIYSHPCGSRTVSLALKRSDGKHLKKFNRWLDSTYPIHKDGNNLRVYISNRKFVVQLHSVKARAIIDCLYSNSTVALDRKVDLAMEIING